MTGLFKSFDFVLLNTYDYMMTATYYLQTKLLNCKLKFTMIMIFATSFSISVW